jgi:cation/acetate symporter
MLTGTLTTLVLIYLSPTIQIDLLGNEAAWFPLRNPAMLTIPLAFAVGIGVSLLARETAAAEAFAEVERRTHLGATAE